MKHIKYLLLGLLIMIAGTGIVYLIIWTDAGLIGFLVAIVLVVGYFLGKIIVES